MTFLQLNYIDEIQSCGSINKAAQNLFVSQSSLSSSIRELEEELGIKIFNRSNRGIVLTDDGREFLAQVRPIIEQHKRVEKYYASRSMNDQARLSISAQRFPFCTKAFVQFLKEQSASKFEFTFKETDMDKVIDNVAQHKSEIGIIFLSDMTEKFMNRVFSASDIVFTEIKKIKPHAYIRRDHPLSSRESLSLSDLEEYPYVVFSRKNNESVYFSEEAVYSGHYDFQKIIYINDRATAYNIMSHTDAFSTGSGLLPEGFAPEEIKAIPLKDNMDDMRLGWIRLRDYNISKKCEEFIALLSKLPSLM